MRVSTVLKSGNTVDTSTSPKSIQLQAASVVALQIGPEQVARFDKIGDDLVLVFKNGSRLVIEDFFITYDDGARSDIVFIDENDVRWWAQYEEPFVHFDIAEIETAVAAFPIAGLLSGLLGAAALGSAGGGSEGSDPVPAVGGSSDEADPDPVDEVGSDEPDPVDEGDPDEPDPDPVDEGGSDEPDPDLVDEGGSDEPDPDPVDEGDPNEPDPDPVDEGDPEQTDPADEGDPDEPDPDPVDEGDSEEPDPEPAVGVDDDASTQEAGIAPGGNTHEGGVTSASGNVLDNDIMALSTPTTISEVVFEDTPGTVGDPLQGTYGTLTLNADGHYTYVLENESEATHALPLGEVAVETFTYTLDDGSTTTTATLNVTVIGTNDIPEITGVDSGLVSEDGVLTRTGQLRVNDPDLGDSHTWSLETQAQAGFGTFTVDQTGQWTYVLDNERPAVQALGLGDTLTDTVLVRVTDAAGGFVDRLVTITINGLNDAPAALDDLTEIQVNGVATFDVLSNDTDQDEGETDLLEVTKIGGQDISPDTPITLPEGVVTIASDGILTFTPNTGFTGTVTIPYTATNTPDSPGVMADWVVIVDPIPTVAISDDARPGDPNTGENLLSTLDDLTNVALDGVLPVDSTVRSLTVSDGTNTVTIPGENITVNPDGTYSTTADLSGLDDGTLTVTLDVVDRHGVPSAPTDTIEKDTVTTVSIDPVDMREGGSPTITGTGAPGDVILLSIDGGTAVQLSVMPDGTWSFTPSGPLPPVEFNISAFATDPSGNTATATRDVASASVSDTQPVDPADLLIEEANLSSGTNPVAAATVVSSTINVGTNEGEITQLSIAGTAIPLPQLLSSDTTPVGPITTTYGAITVTGYDVSSGEISFDFEVNSAATHTNPPLVDAAAGVLREGVQIIIDDNDGDTRETTLNIAIVDDLPTVATDPAFATVLEADEGDLATDVSVSLAGVFELTPGADGISSTVFALEVGSPVSGLTDGASGDPVVLSLEGGVVVGRVGGLGPDAGEVAFRVLVDPATGVVTLDQQRPLQHPDGDGANVVAIAGTAVQLTVSLTDGDGDIATHHADIGARLRFVDDLPDAMDDVVSVSASSTAPVPGNVILDNTGADDLGADTPGVLTHVAGVAIPEIGSVVIPGMFGTLTISADGSYSYLRNPTTPGGTTDEFTYTLQDADGDTDTATLTLNIEDAPVSISDLVAEISGGDAFVNESQLPGGSASGPGGATTSGSFTISSFDGIANLAVSQGSVSTDVITNNALAAGPITLTSALGSILTITGYDPNTGEITYSYDLSGVQTHGAAGRDGIFDTFDLSLTDLDGDTVSEQLSIRIDDDVSTAVNEASLTVVENGMALGTAAGAPNLLDNDTFGSDGARVHSVTYLDDVGGTQTVTIAPMSTGTGLLDAQFGTLEVNADGTWTFTPDAAVPNPSGDPADAGFSYTLIDGDGDVSTAAAQPITVTDTAPVAVDDTAVTLEEATAGVSGNVISNDTPSEDGGTSLQGFTYTNASGVMTQVTFSGVLTSQTVTTPTGTLTVNQDGNWSFIPNNSFDHDARGADATAGSFSYTLTDADGSVSNVAQQPITVTDTAPNAGGAMLTLDEADLPGTGTAGNSIGNPQATQSLGITGADDIANVVFTASTIAGLPPLSSAGTPLVYEVSPDGHTLTATAGSMGPTIFAIEIDNPTDATGASQSVTVSLSAPIDQPGLVQSGLNITYDVQDSDGSITTGNVSFAIVDDTPLTPQADTPVTVAEGGAAVGSANSGDTLLSNDVNGADTGRIYDITYVDAAGMPQSILIPDQGAETVTTEYGSLTVASEGTWSYTPNATVDHTQPANDAALNDNFSYRTIDDDGDISSGSAIQMIEVTDTVPSFGDPADSVVSEAGLPTGSAPNTADLQATGSLDLTPGQDVVNVTLTSTPVGLTSGGVALEYVFTPSNQSVTAYAGPGRTAADRVFTLGLVNPTDASVSYGFTLRGNLDHTPPTPLTLDFGVAVTDSDNDTDTSSFQIVVNDDAPPPTITQTIPEDTSVVLNISADGTPASTTILQGGSAITGTPDGIGNMVFDLAIGEVTVRADGTAEYTPPPNFNGSEMFVVRTDDNGSIADTAIDMTVTPVADAPTQGVDAASVPTTEDTSVALGLQAPVITDDGTGAGNNPTTERIGVITLTGLPANAELRDAGDMLLFTVGVDPVTILISDIPTVTGTTGDLSLTTAQYEALLVRPPLHASENFAVNANVTAFEVDGAGNVVGTGAAATPAVVDVLVQAVTDDAALVFDTSVIAADLANADAVVFTGNTTAEIDLAEDAQINITDILSGTFADLDGSEVRSIQITNTTGQTIRVGTSNVDPGESISIPAAQQNAGIDAFGDILVGGGRHFSGELDGIIVTLVAQDVDSDGFSGGMAGANGIAEADTTNNSVTLNLNVSPVAGDVPGNGLDVTTAEDTAVAFLENIVIRDTSSGTGGTEVIQSVTFDIPAGWDFSPSTVSNGATFTVDQTGAPTVVITFTGGTQADREAVLDGFELTPPAHSSLDVSIDLSIETQDTNPSTGTDTQIVTRTVNVEVTPVAEIVSSDTNNNASDDLTLTPGFSYTSAGTEDTFFDLNSDGFDLAAGWTNEDSDELSVSNPNTYALLTPEVDGGPAIGAVFRWQEGMTTVEQTFSGQPVQISVGSLGTVEFRGPPHASGAFNIEVQALTEDFDDDDEGNGTPDSAISGSAQLVNINIQPVADAASLTVAPRVTGLEDTDIELSVVPASSDPDETFNVVIRDIPIGATVTYDGMSFTATVGDTALAITDFDSTRQLSITPPENSNEDFTLNVDTISVDTAILNGTPTTVQSAPTTRPITVAVRGVADEVTVTATPQTYDEQHLDAGTDTIDLSDLFAVTLTDSDTSETLTILVSDLPEGFTLTEGTLTTEASATGVDRIWALDVTQVANASITVPENFSGDFSFSALPVTSENDGSSLTAAATTLSFSVTPAPEATVTNSAVLAEDVVSPLNLQIVTQNGDTDERIAMVRIPTADTATATYELYLGTGVSATSLATSGVPVVNDGGVDYYVLTPAQAADLSALTAPHLDGVIGDFELQFQIIDDTFDGVVGSTATTTAFQSTTFSLTAAPVTDTPDTTITAITSGSGAMISDEVAGDDALPDTVTLSEADIVTVNLNVASPDSDGTEHVIRILIENVPNGVTVVGAEAIGAESWLVVLTGGMALPINGAGGVDVPIQFDVSDQVTSLPLTQIDMTVQVQDQGNQTTPGTTIEEDSVSWTLATSFNTSGPANDPALITNWEYNGTGAQEDTPLVLSDVINATIAAQSGNPNTVTIQITDLPPGAEVDGMVLTVINGVETYTASVTSDLGDSLSDVQTLLDDLMDSITITPPLESNDNTVPGGLTFTTSLITKVLGGTAFEQETISPAIPVEPVTDPTLFEIGVGAADSDGVLDEADPNVPISINIANLADGAAGSIVDGDLYLQISGSQPDLQGGVLTNADASVTYPLTTVSGVSGIADGDYYVIPGATLGSQVDVVYNPTDMVSGQLAVTATVVNVETGSVNVTSTGSQTLDIFIANDGTTSTSDPTTGTEADSALATSQIQLENLTATLVDDDGSEEFNAILLSNVPEGFVVFTGPDLANATITQNAGGDGVTNTWILSGEGEPLPAYVAILPPINWSGTVSGLELVTASGETALDESRSDTFPVADVTVTPVANGATVTDSSTFGTEGDIVGLNLAVSLNDPEDATTSPAAPDSSTETITLELTGLGAGTSFFIGTTEHSNNITYDAGLDTYTISDLTQPEIETLGFRQVTHAFTDQNAGEANVQIGVSVTTVDGASVSAATTGEVTVSLFDQVATSGDDTLLYGGSPIDALGGEDTVDLRSEDTVSGATLETNLTNVETIDLGVAGPNTLAAITPDQVLAITDSDNALTVTGTSDDNITLDSALWDDLGNGTYADLSGATDVTLTVTGGVQVDFFSNVMAPLGFGLAGVPDPDPETQESEDLPSEEDVLMSGADNMLDGLLPGNDTPPPDTAGGDDAAADLMASSRIFDDDAQDGAVFEA